MDKEIEELRVKLEGLSEAQLRLLIEVAWEDISPSKRGLLVRLAEAMAEALRRPSPKT